MREKGYFLKNIGKLDWRLCRWTKKKNIRVFFLHKVKTESVLLWIKSVTDGFFGINKFVEMFFLYHFYGGSRSTGLVLLH